MLFSKKSNRLVFEFHQDFIKFICIKNKKVSSSLEFNIPDDILGNEFQEDNLIHSKLTDFKKNNSLDDSTPVSLFAYGNIIQSRIVDLPLISESKLRSLIFWDLESHFNIHPDEIYWDFKILGKMDGRCNVIILSIKRIFWDRINAIVNGSKLKLEGIDTPSSAYEKILTLLNMNKNCVTCIYFGNSIASLNFYNDGILIFQREIPIFEGDENEQKFFERWEHTIAFFQANYKIFTQNILISGKIPGFIENPERNIFGIELKVLNSLDEYGASKSSEIPHCICGIDGNAYMSSMRITSNIEEIPKKERNLKFLIPNFSEFHYASILIVVLVVMFFGFKIENLRLVNILKTKYIEYQKFLPIISKLENLKKQKSLLSSKEKLISDLEYDGLTNIPEILDIIAENLPHGSWINNLQIKKEKSSDILKMTGYCGNYEEQMNFFSTLKNTKMFSEIDVTDMHKSSSEKGLWNFIALLKVRKDMK